MSVRAERSAPVLGRSNFQKQRWLETARTLPAPSIAVAGDGHTPSSPLLLNKFPPDWFLDGRFP